ncbi:MAG: 50S ribosomal protein L7/L12 [Kamptonema sp. SIO4C4]|nr:50S ribosomal protein L7/L12 [Kamptonema sp. SIO4C4]
MSTKVTNIIEQMKTLTLVEAAELIEAIENNFGVDASPMTVKFTPPTHQDSAYTPPEFTLVNVVLENAPNNKKVAIIKAVWSVTGLGLKHAKGLVKKTPSIVKPSVTLSEAQKIKQHLESYGASVSLQPLTIANS